jgi:tRNA-Thr(GGU) m(6)t(6)A37 methyltransferase TsaA
MKSINFKPIGIIRTPFTEPEKTPIQSCFAGDSRGSIELNQELTAGLKDLEVFSHLWIIYCFHRAEGYDLLAKPFLDKDKKGIFATRFYKRPNAIGISVVRLIRIAGAVLEVAGVDVLDGTPLLDIKPYVPRFDIREGACDGWFSKASEWQKYAAPDADVPVSKLE